MHEAITNNINSLDDLRIKLDSIQDIIDDKNISEELRNRLLKYQSDIGHSFENYAYSLGNVIDQAHYA